MSEKVLAALKIKFADAVLDSHSFRGDDTAVVKRESIVDVCTFLKESPDAAFDMPIDVTCVDYSTYSAPAVNTARFMVVYHLRSTSRNHRIRLKVPLRDDDPAVDSVTGVWKGVVWLEREVYDMFGVKFNGHPDLRRLLLYPEFQGHPLRKEYPVRGYQPPMDMPTLKGEPIPGVTVDEEDAE